MYCQKTEYRVGAKGAGLYCQLSVKKVVPITDSNYLASEDSIEK